MEAVRSLLLVKRMSSLRWHRDNLKRLSLMNSTRLRDNERSNSVEETTQSKSRVPDLVRLGPAKNVDLRPGCGRRRLFANRAHDGVVTFLYISGAAQSLPALRQVCP